MANRRLIGFMMADTRSSSHIGVMEAQNRFWMMSMIFVSFLLALMVVTVTRRGAGNGGGRGNRGGRGNFGGRGNGWRGNGGEGSSGNNRAHDSGEDANRTPATSIFERADRSVSTGHHPNVPLEGQPKLGIVSFTGKYINENVHKKTLKAIARDRWPRGAVDSIGKPRSQFFDDEYYKAVLDEFQRYYDYEEGVPVEVARYKVKEHLKNNLKSMISWELRQANKRVQNSAQGTTRHDVKPVHIQLDAWNALCDWWDSAKFRAMSKQNKENRKRKMLLHTTGAKPYVIFRQECEKKEGRMLTLVEFFDATHEKKNQKGTFWTPEAANRMRALLVKGWDDYRHNHGMNEASTSSPTASLPMSPNKRIRAEAEVACSLSKELGTHAHRKNRLFMGGRANLSDIYSGDELLVQRNSRMTSTNSVSLSPELLQRAMGTAAIIVHAYDSDDSVARIEIEDHIERLATEVIPKEDIFWGEYTRVAFSMVATIFTEYKKTITEDSHDDDNPHISDDELLN